jgi:hypothetical protein
MAKWREGRAVADTSSFRPFCLSIPNSPFDVTCSLRTYSATEVLTQLAVSRNQIRRQVLTATSSLALKDLADKPSNDRPSVVVTS